MKITTGALKRLIRESIDGDRIIRERPWSVEYSFKLSGGSASDSDIKFASLGKVTSPKSTAFPTEEKVILSITLRLEPPQNNPTVGDCKPALEYLATVRSPKSVALPVVAVVI